MSKHNSSRRELGKRAAALLLALVAGGALLVTGAVGAAEEKTRAEKKTDISKMVIDGASADTVLKRGDVLVKCLGPDTKIDRVQFAIQDGQKVFKRLAGAFHAELKQGDTKVFHVAIYLGGGKTAEAYGLHLKNSLVGPFTIDTHAGYVLQVFRPSDAKLAEAAAKVAETWANPRRMKYLVPATAPLKFSYFGPKARKEALNYGQFADKAGGPPDVQKMFCSEFVLASYQAAFVKGLLAKSPKLKAADVTVPNGMNLQASHASPFAYQSHLMAAVEKGVWKKVGMVLVKPK